MDPAAATRPPSLDPYAIFLRARSAVSAAHYPRRVNYTIAITGLDGTTPRSNHYRANSRPDDGIVNVAPISQEEAAQPAPVPHDWNFNVYVQGIQVPVGRPPPRPDLIGVPLLAPTYMFGLTYRRQHEREAQTATASNMEVIAVVSSGARDYSVKLVDTSALDCAPSYHLKLTPLREPKENRLRELWLDANDYLPRKALVAGNFTLAPFVQVPWTIDFSIIGGAPFISQESAAAPLYISHRHVVSDATIAFENVGDANGSLYDVPLVTPDIESTTLIEP